LQIPRISTRGYYDLTNGKTLKKNPYFLYPKKSFKKLSGKKEITIMIHGMQNDRNGAVSKFKIAKKRLKELGYSNPVIGFSYDANTKGAHLKKTEAHALRTGQKIAKKNGVNLSKFILDFKEQNTKTKIRLIGHSLGAEVILSTLESLSRETKIPLVESVHFFGASLISNVASSKKSSKILQKMVTSKIINYYSPSDEVLRHSYEMGFVKSPIGLFGASGKPIPKYIQKKVKPRNHRFVSYARTLMTFPY